MGHYMCENREKGECFFRGSDESGASVPGRAGLTLTRIYWQATQEKLEGYDIREKVD
jgi:hypothetical protein